MPQFFIDRKFSEGEEIEIKGADARHIAGSLRLARNDWIVLSDGEGHSFKATITSSSPSRVSAKVESEIQRIPRTQPPVLALAVIKKDRFEFALQKTVELGIRRIIPMTTVRTVTNPSEVDQRKLSRWNKIVLEAAKQSGLPFVPTVEKPASFNKICELAPTFSQAVIFYEGEDAEDASSFWRVRNRSNVKEDILIVGPEGGFTRDEVNIAKDNNIRSLSLGAQILRVETAAIAVVTVWQYELGNMKI